MTKSTKAALLSGLVFPGIGHFVLKQYVRGSILIGIIDSYRVGIALEKENGA